jgi:RNA polymerase sigma factor (sigma-70 family)
MTHAEKNAELYPLVAAGSAAAAEQMVALNTPLVFSLASRFVAGHPSAENLRDDLGSVGCAALLVAVRTLATPHEKVRSLSKYLGTAIVVSFRNLCEREFSLVGECERGQRYRKQRGEMVKVFDRDDCDLRGIVDDSFEQEIAASETLDVIFAACRDETDKQIVRLRIDGYVDTEIAEMLSLSKDTVHRSRLRIEKRFDEIIRNINEEKQCPERDALKRDGSRFTPAQEQPSRTPTTSSTTPRRMAGSNATEKFS